MKYINSENVFDYAFINTDTLVYPIRAVCVCFHGYTDATVYSKSDIIAKIMGENGIAWVFPYYSVWAWMSSSSQMFNEQVIDAVYEKLGLDNKIPLMVSGGSMGGLTAFNYLIYGKRKACLCALNCPVTDFVRIFIDRREFRKAILSAHIEEDGDILDVLKKYSPVEFADKLPKIPYLLIFGESDEYFIKNQMPQIVDKLNENRVDYKLFVQSDMKHCDIISHSEAKDTYCKFIIDNAGKLQKGE